MPSQLALVLCFIFIFIIFIIEYKQNPTNSRSLWVPLIWLLYSSSRSLYLWLNPNLASEIDIENIDYTAGSPIDRNFLILLMLIGLIILYRRKLKWSQILRCNVPILLLYLYMGLSIAWSNYPVVSLKRWIRVVGDLIMILIILSEPEHRDAIKSVMKRSAYILLPLSILFIKYYRNLGVQWTIYGEQMVVGVTRHKNSLGELSLIFGAFFIWDIFTDFKKIYVKILFIIISISLLVISSSTTSVIVFILILVIIILLFIMKNKVNEIGGVISIIPMLIIGIQILFIILLSKSALGKILSVFGKDLTFTDRTLIWRELIRYASRHPILGAGYGGFWIGNLGHGMWDKFKVGLSQGHNGYIDIYLQLGIVGLALFAVVIVDVYVKIGKTLSFDYDYGGLQLILLMIALLHNMSESTFIRSTHIMWYLFLLVAIKLKKIEK